MPKTVVRPSAWQPDPRGLHSPAIQANGFVFVSGTLPVDPDDGQIVADDIRSQTHQVLKNISAVLVAADSSLDQVVKTNIYLVRQEDFATMNEVYREYFPSEPPARATVCALLLRPGALIEIEVIAAVP